MLLKRNNNNGVTLVELLISMSLTSLVLILAFWVQLSASKTYLKWESNSRLGDVAGLISKSFANSVTEATEITNLTRNSVAVSRNDLRSYVLEFTANGEVLTNNQNILPVGFHIDRYNYEYLVCDDSEKAVWVNYENLDIDENQRINHDELTRILGVKLKYVLANNEHESEFENIAIIRKY